MKREKSLITSEIEYSIHVRYSVQTVHFTCIVNCTQSTVLYLRVHELTMNYCIWYKNTLYGSVVYKYKLNINEYCCTPIHVLMYGHIL